MPFSGFSVFHGVNPNLLKKSKNIYITCFDLWLNVYSMSMVHAEKSLEYFKICLFRQNTKQPLSKMQATLRAGAWP